MPQLILDLNTHTEKKVLTAYYHQCSLQIFIYFNKDDQTDGVTVFWLRFILGQQSIVGNPELPAELFCPRGTWRRGCIWGLPTAVWIHAATLHHSHMFNIISCISFDSFVKKAKQGRLRLLLAVLLLVFSLHSQAVVRSDRYSGYILITYVTLQTHSPLSSIRRTNCDMPPATGDFFLQSLSLPAEHNLLTEGRSMWSWCRLSRKKEIYAAPEWCYCRLNVHWDVFKVCCNFITVHSSKWKPFAAWKQKKTKKKSQGSAVTYTQVIFNRLKHTAALGKCHI